VYKIQLTYYTFIEILTFMKHIYKRLLGILCVGLFLHINAVYAQFSGLTGVGDGINYTNYGNITTDNAKGILFIHISNGKEKTTIKTIK